MAKDNVTRRVSIYVNGKEVENSLKGVEGAMAQVRNRLRLLNKDSETYDKDSKELTETMTALKQKQSEYREELGLTNKAMKEASLTAGGLRGAVSGVLDSLFSGDLESAKKGLLDLKNGMTGLLKSTLSFIATPLGATIAVLAGIAVATKEWIKYNEEVAKANRITEAITKLAGESLNQARTRAQVIEEVYGKDFEEVLNTANVLVNEFQISFEEALDKIEEGLVKGDQYNEEYLSSIAEYSTFFAKAGYSVEEFQSIINAGFDLGIYTDKLPDALKEADLSLKEQTKSTRDALINAFGSSFTDDILTRIRSGQTTTKQALEEISQKAKESNLSQKQYAQLTADVFKGAGEDAGGALKIFQAIERSYELQTAALTPLQESLNEVATSQERVIEAQDALVQSDGFELWKNNLIVIFNEVKKGFYDTINAIVNGFPEDKIKQDAEKKAINNYTTDAINAFEEYLKLREKTLGKEFDLEEVRQERLATIREQYANSGAGSWDASEAEIEMQKRLEAELEAIKNYVPKFAKTSLEKTEAEIDAEEKARAAAAKKRKAEEEKNARDSYRIAKELADAKANLAKAQLNQYLLELRSALDKEKSLTPEYLALNEDKLDSIRNAQQEFNRDELQRKIADLEAKAKLEKTSQETLNIEKTALNIEYNLKNQELDLEFQKATDELKKQYEEEQKILKAEQLYAQYELEILEANDKLTEEQLRQKLAYQKELADYRQLLEDKKITQEEYDRFRRAAAKKQDELDRVRELQALNTSIGGLREVADAVGIMFGQSKELALIQAGINGAMAITSILAQYPKFDGGFAMYAAIASAGLTTAAQIKEISKAKAPKTPKFYYGGHTGSEPALGTDEYGAITGYVHKDEYVIPKIMTQDPQFADTITWLEHNRKIKLGKFVDGGEASPGVVPNPQQQSNNENTLLLRILSQLDNTLSSGINANLYLGYQDVKAISDMNDEINESTKNGTVS